MVYGVQSISRLGTEITRTFCASGCDLFINPRSSLITEFGWSAVHWENGKEIQQDGHLCVQERKYYTNTFIPNNREVSANPGSYTADGIDTPPQHYQFGTSEYIDKKEFKVRIQTLISELSKLGPLYLVFHDYSQDIK